MNVARGIRVLPGDDRMFADLFRLLAWIALGCLWSAE